jgi:hypothetical protein
MQWENGQGAEFDNPAASAAIDKQRESRLMQLAIVLSLGLHGLLALLLLRDQSLPQPGNQSTPQFVRINLLPENPLSLSSAESLPEPEAVTPELPTLSDEEIPPPLAEEAEEAETVVEDIVVEDIVVEDTVVEDIAEAPEPVLVESAEPSPEEGAADNGTRLAEAPPTGARPAMPLITLPNVNVVQSTLQQMQDDERSQLWLRGCTRRQEENDLLDCEPSRQADYSTARRSSAYNRTYQSLQPVRSLSRSERTLPTITENQAALAARLAAADIDQGLVDSLLQQTDAAITEGSNTGNRNIEQIIRMTDRSAAAQQAERVLGDAWIQLRSRELQQRRRVEP